MPVRNPFPENFRRRGLPKKNGRVFHVPRPGWVFSFHLPVFDPGKMFVHSAQIMLFVFFQKTGLFPEKFSIPFPDQFRAGRNLERFPFPFCTEGCLLPEPVKPVPMRIDIPMMRKVPSITAGTVAKPFPESQRFPAQMQRTA